MPEAEENLALRVELGRIDSVQQFTDVLIDLDRAYNALYYFLDLTHDIENLYRHWWRYLPELVHWAWFLPVGRMPGGRRRLKLGTIIIGQVEDFSVFVLPSDRLVLKACQIGSPGWIDILGKLNPLQILREYHEMRKDREYRERAEKERLHLENELLRNQVIRERIEILKELGFPRSTIKEIVNSVLKEPLEAFGAHVDNGNIRGLESLSQSTGGKEARQ